MLTSYARRVLKINENGLTARRSVGPPPGDLWLCSSPLRHSRDFSQKPPGLSPYFRPLDSVPSKLIDKLRQTAQHYGQQVKKLHTSKVKHTQTEQSERSENRYQTHNNESPNEYSHIQQISTGYAKITRYSVSKKQDMNNKLNTEHRKRKLKQRHVIC